MNIMQDVRITTHRIIIAWNAGPKAPGYMKADTSHFIMVDKLSLLLSILEMHRLHCRK